MGERRGLKYIWRTVPRAPANLFQKVRDVRVLSEEGDWVLEVDGAGDLTMERLASLARGDFLTEVFGRKLAFREARSRVAL